MKPYPKYKPSDIQWLGDIPEHWEVKKLKYVTSINDDVLPENTDENFHFDYVDIECVTEGKILNPKDFSFKEAPSRARRIVVEGDVIVSTVRTYLKAIAQIKSILKPTIVSTGFAVVRSSKTLNKEFLNHLLRESTFIDSVMANSKGVSYPAISSQELKEITLTIPPLPEQTAIAQFLDQKTAQIDTLIAQKQRLITLLKEERMAFINEQFANDDKKWEIRKVSRSFNLIGSGTTPEAGNPQYYQNGEINWINTGDLNDGLLEFCNKKITKLAFDSFSSLKIYPKGTLLIAMYGATIGKTSILGIEGCTNQACCALADSPFFDIKFVFYWFLGNKQAIINLSYGGGQPNISQEVIRTLKIPCPPLKTQQKIAESIETTTGKIDATLAKIVQEIELLKEYRVALISEVVTGKISVV